MKRKTKKSNKAVDFPTLLVSAILDLIVGLTILLVDRLI